MMAAQSHITPDPLQGTVGGTTPFEMQAALIPDENKFEYESAAEMLRIMQTTINSGSAEEYFLYFHGVTHDDLPEIDKEFFASNIQGTVRFTTENILQALICRMLPGWRHRTLSLNLSIRITFKITDIPGNTLYSTRTFCGTRFDFGNIRSKEGHQPLGPATRGAKGVWPSVAMEVGYSQAMDFLRLDAERWLINSAGAIRHVILVQLMTDSLALHIECWAMAPAPQMGTRQSPNGVPRCVQQFKINTNGAVISTSPELRIPYTAIFDEPNENPPDVVFTNAELSSFALQMFEMMN